jgi:hypothetical protein
MKTKKQIEQDKTIQEIRKWLRDSFPVDQVLHDRFDSRFNKKEGKE